MDNVTHEMLNPVRRERILRRNRMRLDEISAELYRRSVKQSKALKNPVQTEGCVNVSGSLSGSSSDYVPEMNITGNGQNKVSGENNTEEDTGEDNTGKNDTGENKRGKDDASGDNTCENNRVLEGNTSEDGKAGNEGAIRRMLDNLVRDFEMQTRHPSLEDIERHYSSCGVVGERPNTMLLTLCAIGGLNFYIEGPSGSGKSLLLDALMKLVVPIASVLALPRPRSMIRRT